MQTKTDINVYPLHTFAYLLYTIRIKVQYSILYERNCDFKVFKIGLRKCFSFNFKMYVLLEKNIVLNDFPYVNSLNINESRVVNREGNAENKQFRSNP